MPDAATPKYVFLSSTAKDLADYRSAVIAAIEGLDGYHCVRMENFGARASEADDFCRKKVGECQLFVGIVGHLYGSTPKDDARRSYTELEYEAACDYQKPRLMFVAPKDFNVPAHLIDEELERDPESRRKQRAFRERTLSDIVAAASFYTPEELAGLVRQAIHNWERQEEQTEAIERVRPPDAGPLVPQTCDRVDQEADFRRHFPRALKHRPGFPQFYIVHGDERESHTSFIERLRLTTLQEYVAFRWGDQQASVPIWDLEWPEPDELATRREQLKAFVFERIDPQYAFKGGDYSASDLREMLRARSQYPLVTIHHRVSTRGWDTDDAKLVRWYVEFWDEVKADANIPQVILFLSVVYPPEPADGLLSFISRMRHQSEKKRVHQELREICTASARRPDEQAKLCAAVLLDELRCVKPEDVMKWFMRHRIGADDMERERRCREIFMIEGGDASECRNMRDVESRLSEIHRQFVVGRVRP